MIGRASICRLQPQTTVTAGRQQLLIEQIPHLCRYAQVLTGGRSADADMGPPTWRVTKIAATGAPKSHERPQDGVKS